jgi:hypothetical protein
MANLPASLEGLTFAEGSSERTETRAGVPIFNGSASGLQEWKFKVNTRMAAIMAEKDEDIRNQKCIELTGKIVDALTEEALKVAMDIGTENILKVGGLQKLITELEAHVMATKEDEARELYHFGAKLNGPLSRQLTDRWPDTLRDANDGCHALQVWTVRPRYRTRSWLITCCARPGLMQIKFL